MSENIHSLWCVLTELREKVGTSEPAAGHEENYESTTTSPDNSRTHGAYEALQMSRPYEALGRPTSEPSAGPEENYESITTQGNIGTDTAYEEPYLALQMSRRWLEIITMNNCPLRTRSYNHRFNAL